ncbi:MAG: hypothetical protein QOE79_1927 [Sphingomonadales bacterium]|jgi:hypothetical protein|nr:hypothetical protein [Sphingomonadales bacterium]
MIPAFLLLAAASPPQPQGFDCRLATPSGDAVAFVLQTKVGDGAAAAFLVPSAGSVWPSGPLAGGGGAAMKKEGLEGAFYFGGFKTGISLKINGDKALAYSAASKAPRAYGFCRALPAGEQPPRPGMVAVDPGAGIPAFDSAGWIASDCALLTRSGRRGRIGYSLVDGGARAEIKSEGGGFFAEPRMLVSRTQGSGNQPTRFGSGAGPEGTERLVVDPKTREAVQLIDFAQVGTPPNPAEGAVAICGHAGIVRRPVMQ